MKTVIGSLLCLACALSAAQGQVTQPMVAIHDSELTRALETMPASPPTPTGAGTTGFQWWPTDWHYFVMPEALKEALRSDGTAFTVVGDSNITAGLLLTNGQPKYPIVISLASEAIRDDEIAQFTNYVAAGGFLLVGSSAFTRTTSGATRGDFAFANALGVHLVTPGLNNWTANNTFTKQVNHPLIQDFPSGALTNRLPDYAEEISWGISPSHPFLAPHDLWQVKAGDATVLATGNNYPYLLVKPYGKGYFIYHAAFQPLIGHGGFAPAMYAYMIFRRAIEWSFTTANLPVPKLSPWPYPYNAAFMIRHDLEDFTNEIADILPSAQVEYNNGAKGDYYFCTGTLRVDASRGYNTNTMVSNMRTAVSTYGATIGPHNGGLKNPNNPALARGDYDYWHWGPDEALDVTPSGYTSGKAYATASISNSFNDIEGWLKGLTNGLRGWVGCYFNATRDDSYDLQDQLNVRIAGDQKIGPFPHWTFSTRTAGKRYRFLSEPVSDWFVSGLVAQSLEPWHAPGVQTSTTMHAGVDFYYNLGFLINFYSHTLSTGEGGAGQLVPDYLTYSLNAALHPRLWSANALSVYQWWLQRSNAQVRATCAAGPSQSTVTFTISGATHTNTAVELVLPGTNAYCGFQLWTNGVLAGPANFRVNGQTVKILVGTAITNAVFAYAPVGASTLLFSQNFDGVTAPTLPAGWTTSASGAQSPWVTQTSVRDTTPNAAFSADASNIGVNQLVSPSISLPAGQALLRFRNSYNLETGTGTDGFDGGVLEIAIGTNPFTDIVTAGGSFVSGGYNSVIDTAYANPLAGRPAWSGNSGGFITTLVNLPPSAGGQTIQLRWRCGTDNSNGSSGWWIDSISITNTACLCCSGTTNTPPVLPSQPNRTIPELTTLTVTNTATDPNVPPQTLTYSFLTAPANAAISSTGIITWTPAEGQGPSTNVFTTVVSDNGVPPLNATNSFSVFVTEVNTAPILPTQSNRTISALTPLTVTNTASDSDLPPQTLSYSLIAPPAGAAINANGIITWTPSQAQSPSTNLITTVVTDNGVPPLSASNSFLVFVTNPNNPPVITSQPVSRTNAAGTTATFTVGAAGTSLNYQWLKGSSAITGATSSTLTLLSVSDADAAGYSAIVSNAFGAVTSATAILTVIDPPVITTNPVSRTNLAGTTATFSVGATGTALKYQWLKGSSAIAGATSSTLTLLSVSNADTASYSAVVSNTAGSITSSTATLTVISPPVIVTQPTSQTSVAGGTASFTVTASGTGLTYQWLKNGTNALVNGGRVSGANTASLTLSNLASADAGGYSVSITNLAGAVTSATATLTVSLANLSPGLLFTDNFTRSTNPPPLAPWLIQSGVWQITNSTLRGGPNTLQTYGFAYITNSWSDYWVQAQIQFPSGAYGGGLGGRLNPTTGAHYGAWIYPENSGGGSHVLKLVKFQSWTAWGYNGASYTPMQQVTLASVSTNWHAVKLAFIGTRIAVYFDGALLISMTDTEATPYLNGAVSFDLWTASTAYAMSAENVLVSTLTAPNAFTLSQGGALTVPSAGVLTNDTGVFSTNLTAALVTGVTSGTLSLSANGGFTYTPSPAFSGTDSFVYQAGDGQTNLGLALVTLNVTGTNAPAGLSAPLAQTSSLLNTLNTTTSANSSALPSAVVQPAPVLQSVRLLSGNAVITWSAVSGGVYRVQFTENLGGSNWTDVTPDIPATGATATATHPLGQSPQRFYRVILLP